MQLKRRQLAFTLVEMAISFSIIVLLLGSAMVAFSTMVENRNMEETNRRLNAAVDAIVGFAIVNKRLPCPAVAGATGAESPTGGGTCTHGLLPAMTVGFVPVDARGYGMDAWGNPIRYSVAMSGTAGMTGCTGSSTLPHLTSAANLKSNGVSCKPGTADLDICNTATNTTATSCNTASRVVDQSTVAFVVYSQGKNWAEASTTWSADEQENADNDSVFVVRHVAPSGSPQGYFDDQIIYVPIGVLYAKLIAAGVLP
jgi:type II secretory pathway pseudopilin PulG